MKTLPRALTALGSFPQFILCQLVEKDDGQIKQPIDPNTGYAGSAIDPKNWMTFEAAQELIESFKAVGDDSYRLGFTFTAEDPFWFYDIDHCIDEEGTFNDIANWSLTTFQGAAVERSQSGTGLHIFGTGTVPPHGCKDTKFGIELYTQDRFVMFGDWENMEGDIWLDWTPQITELAEKHFPKTGGDWDGDWNDFAQEGWDGPEDDGLLIAAAMKAVSQNAAFGSKIKFEDLFNANTEKLAEFFPPQNDHDEYDMSSADASLAQALAFWTGGNHERIKRVMEMSLLKRDKWEDREDYLPRTIGRAVSLQESYYNVNYKGSSATDSAQPVSNFSEGAPDPTEKTMLFTEEQRSHFAGCVYISAENKAFMPDGRLLDKARFDVDRGGKTFTMDDKNAKTTKSAWECFTQSQAIAFPKVHGRLFLPKEEPGKIVEREGKTFVNTYVPAPTRRKVGDPTPFLQLVAAIVPDERDRNILLGYLAGIVQNPGEKFRYTIVLQGAEGNGKSTLAEAVAFAVGNTFTARPNASELAAGGAKFNGWLYEQLFVILEEAKGAGRKGAFMTIMKTLLTAPRIQFQFKGGDQFDGENVANWLVMVNGKGDVPVDGGNRRYSVIFSHQQTPEDLIACGMDDAYWTSYYTWLTNQDGYEIINEYLHTLKIADEFNPVLLARAPHTSSMDEAIEESRDPLELAILEAIGGEVRGFSGGWVSFTRAMQYLADTKRMYPTANALASALDYLGYVKHPNLSDGRAAYKIPGDGDVRSRLYVKMGHMSFNHTQPKLITEAYEKAQGYQVNPNEVFNHGTV